MTIRAGGALAVLVLAFGACASGADESAADRADADTTTTTEREATTTTEPEPTIERVERLWTSAELADDGSAQVTEVIDYDFGVNERHGIFRYVWDLSPEAAITVESPDAPDAILVTPAAMGGRTGAMIRIGDPNVTVSGRHRYRIDYPLPAVARGTTLDWEAVGVGWEVGLEEVDIHVVAPFELLDATCSVGVTGSQGGARSPGDHRGGPRFRRGGVHRGPHRERPRVGTGGARTTGHHVDPGEYYACVITGPAPERPVDDHAHPCLMSAGVPAPAAYGLGGAASPGPFPRVDHRRASTGNSCDRVRSGV